MDIPLLFFLINFSQTKQNQSGWFKHFLGIVNIFGKFENTMNVGTYFTPVQINKYNTLPCIVNNISSFVLAYDQTFFILPT